MYLFSVSSQVLRTEDGVSEEALTFQEINKERRQTLRQSCKNLDEYMFVGGNTLSIEDLSETTLNHIIVEETNRVLYCYVPKVACTNWKRVLLAISGKVEIDKNDPKTPFGLGGYEVHFDKKFNKIIRKLSSYTKAEIKYRLKNYFKFLFVREPTERIYSAYRNKIQLSEDEGYNQKYRRMIIDKYRVKEERGDNDIPRFEEFIKFILDSKMANVSRNEHWSPIFDICAPCTIKYDAIGKYENLEEEAQDILNLLHVGGEISFPKHNATLRYVNRTKTVDLLEDGFKNVTNDDFQKLLRRYEPDFELFGYNVPDVLRKQYPFEYIP